MKVKINEKGLRGKVGESCIWMVVKSYIFFPVVEIFITVADEVQYFTTEVYKAYFQSV